MQAARKQSEERTPRHMLANAALFRGG